MSQPQRKKISNGVKIEKSAGVIVFRENAGRQEWLLLSIDGRRWDFPKGNIEKGEDVLTAALREVAEETSLKDVSIVPGFKKTFKVFYQWEGERRLKFITFLLGQSQGQDVKISFEHKEFNWLPYKEALTCLTFKNSKGILSSAQQFLSGVDV